MAAFGGMTAAVALLSGQPASRPTSCRTCAPISSSCSSASTSWRRSRSPARTLSGRAAGGDRRRGIVGGSFPRSFLVPGTDTSIRVGGEIREVFDYFFSGGNPNRAAVEHHPRRQRPGAGDPAQHPRRRSRRARRRRWRGPAATRSLDRARVNRSSTLKPAPRPPGARRAPTWNSTGPARPRSRRAAATRPRCRTTCIPACASPMPPSAACWPARRIRTSPMPTPAPKTIDFGGTFGDPGVVRVPQVRYTMPLAPYGFLGAFSVSAETPGDRRLAAGPGIIGQDASVRVAPRPPVPVPRFQLVVGTPAITCSGVVLDQTR